MKQIILIFSLLALSRVGAFEFTVASYNCGGLADHYDYIRAAVMQKLIQERYEAEPEMMAEMAKVERLALRVLFGTESEKAQALKYWDKKNYQQFLDKMTMDPILSDSPNARWYEQSEKALTSYKIRPPVIFDKEVEQVLNGHLADLSAEGSLEKGRAKMAKRIFNHYLKQDIICMQEADYLDAAMFPAHYQVIMANQEHSLQAIAWNTHRFSLIEEIGNVDCRGYIIKLLDEESGKTILVASAHITGCDPFKGKEDGKKGNQELATILDCLDLSDADIKIIGMDSNVTATHPRLALVKDYGYKLDYKNYLEPTCTNPYQMLNTRIDWITAKGDMTMQNIPILGIGLNSIQSNMSDHKPIATKISY